jgi:tRNA pseudouridine38-40 synthase
MKLASGSSLEANQSMPRYKLTIEYDGTPFVGWQMQENDASVQGRLAEAIKAFSGEDAIPRGAGRTDAGVHALGQVAHFDLAKEWSCDTVRDALNAVLRPDPISVLACETVGADFDARFSAKGRHYLYAAHWRSSGCAPGGCFAPSTPKPWTRRRKF